MVCNPGGQSEGKSIFLNTDDVEIRPKDFFIWFIKVKFCLMVTIMTMFLLNSIYKNPLQLISILNREITAKLTQT